MSAEDLTVRAQRMRHWALTAPGPLALAYRRRAMQLEFLATTTNDTEAL